MPLRPFHNPGAGFEYRLTVALSLAAAAVLSILVVRLLLPWLVLAALIGGAAWVWWRQRSRQQALHRLFYAQIKAHQGRISVLDFAIAAQITGGEARQFLDQRAKDFWGDFEPTPAGDVLYTFRSCSQTTAVEAPAIALSLTTADLAKRLACRETDLTLYRDTPTFLAWSRQRDPDGCGWGYDRGSDRYWPVPKP